MCFMMISNQNTKDTAGHIASRCLHTYVRTAWSWGTRGHLKELTRCNVEFARPTYFIRCECAKFYLVYNFGAVGFGQELFSHVGISGARVMVVIFQALW